MHDAATSPTSPPQARRLPVRREHFGASWVDPYAWLRDPGWPDVTDPAILAHLRAENAWADAVMAPQRPLVERLFLELCGRIEADDASVPVREGAFDYRWRYRPDEQYRVWLRRPAGAAEAAETVILDENELARDRRYFALRMLRPSPDGRLLAYTTDDDGSERYALHLVDLEGGRLLADLVVNTSGAVVWAEDGRTLLYVELDPHLRPFRVKAHRLGSDAAGDGVLLEEPDPAFFVNIGKTLSRRFLTIVSGTHDTRETHLVDAAAPAAPRLVAARRPGHRYAVDEAHGRLWILSDDRHPNFRLVSAPAGTPGEPFWREEIAAADGVHLIAHACFDRFLALRLSRDGLPAIHLRGWEGDGHDIAFPEAVCHPLLGDNRTFATGRIQVACSSMVTPATVYDYEVATRRLVARKAQRIPSGYDPSRYVTERLSATAADGTPVPITLLRHRDTALPAPLLVYVYGAYGNGLEAAFVHFRLSLVDRGIIYALAHVRGGDEKGPRWWHAGKLGHKVNSFTDTIACVEHLLAAGIARPGAVAIKGGSAGGLLVGAVLNMRPELWHCAVAEVPFVDVLDTMLDPTLLLTPIEWPEWGNPVTDEAAFDTIRGYSPYDNVRAQAYPHLLVTAGLSDPRVGYWEPAKWVAKLRATKTDGNHLLLRTHMDAGHFGRSGRYETLRDLAEQYAFLLMCLDETGAVGDPAPVAARMAAS